MFLDKLNEAEKAIDRCQSKEKNLKQEGTFTANLTAINDAIQEIINQMMLSNEAKALVPNAGLNDDRRSNLYDQLNQIRYDLDEGADVTEGKKKLVFLSKDFVEDENKKWKSAVEEKANAQVSLLQQLKGVTESPEATSMIIARIKGNAVQMPKDIKGIWDYVKVLQNADNIVKKVGATPEVMVFINKVATGHAYLSDLNDEVNNWINEHHLQKSIRIIFDS